MQKRVISGAIYVALLLALGYLGGIFWLLGVMAFIFLCALEYGRIGQHWNMAKPNCLFYILAVIIPVLAYLDARLMGFGVCLVLFALGIANVLGKLSFEDFCYQFLGIIYTSFFLSHLVLLRQMSLWFLFFFFVIVWVTDSAAFFVGSALGRHKLIPTISPNKTWEGAIGGVFFCVVIMVIYNALLLHMPLFRTIMIALLCSIAGQAGDILESALKRWGGVKDSGNIMPGHGGALDRLDSMMIVAPLGYYIFIIADVFFQVML